MNSIILRHSPRVSLNPEYTANSDALGTLRLQSHSYPWIGKETRFYQASTSEMYGLVQETPQKETTPFYPCSPYSASLRLLVTVNYRRHTASCQQWYSSIMNHPSRRNFVTRKITMAVARISQGLQERPYLGNLDAKRDWGHARITSRDVRRQQPKPNDYVLLQASV